MKKNILIIMKWEIALVRKFNNNLIFKKKFKYKLPKDIDENFGLADPFLKITYFVKFWIIILKIKRHMKF